MKVSARLALVAALSFAGLAAQAQTLLNASYDVAREFYKDYNAAFIAHYKKTTGKVDAVHPSISIVAENPVAVVERTVAKKGTAELAKAYLDYLYSEEAQEIAAKHALRPRNPTVLKKYSATFKPIQLFTVNELFGSLAEA